MLLIIKKVVFLVGLTLYITGAHSQTVTSTRNGVWNDPAVWSSGIVPSSANATTVVVDHEVELPASFVVSAFNVFVNNKLTLRGSSQLTILPDAFPTQDLSILGTLVKEDGAILNGTSTANTIFAPGSVYIHRQGPLGFIPFATWDKTSTFIINGFKDSGYINIAHSDSWKQAFGNVVYDCPQQTIFVVDLNGYLRNVAGDFVIRSTNNKTLRLSTTQNPTINIGGSLLVEGPSELWFSTNGTSTVVNIQDDFKYSSTSTGPSYLTTRGMISINVLGNLQWSSPGPLRMASSSADSLGLRKALVNLSGDLSVGPGVIIAPPSGSGNGKIVFKGVGTQSVNSSATGSSFQGNLDYTVESASTVDLGSSALSNASGTLQVFGTLRVGSSDPLGAIQLTNKGNIQILGSRRYEPGSTIVYGSNSAQWIGNGHPWDANVNLTIENAETVTLLQSVLCRDVHVSVGTLSGLTNSLSIYGDAIADPSTTLDVEVLRFVGNGDQSIRLEDLVVNNINVNKPGGLLSLYKPLSLRGVLQIESSNTTLRANGYLTLLSTSDDGTRSARVGPLPEGSIITGDVTVQRYMGAEGRIFRYLSSPVKEASVASLMDDFAITGRFVDPATGNGVNSQVPSFYYYDESEGSLQGGWMPYPVSGLAKDNPLEQGRGYCALLRQWAASVVWDVTGTLNQGEIELPVAMTMNAAPSNGWNLVGNPYACTIDWDIDGPNGWSKENISPIFCIRDNGIGSWGSVRYWDGDINYSDIPEGQIAVGQSFWVKATGSNPRLISREGVKVTNDASFYRAQSYIPSFVLILQRDEIKDKAYFKVRPGASPSFDLWDAIKMDNDYFDISTLSDDGFSLAINSRDSLPCGEENIRVRIKDVRRGTYKIHLETKYDFNAYNFTLIDNYFRSETSMRPGEPIDLEITDDPASKSPDRFTLRLNEIMPLDSLDVRAPFIVCNAAPIPITIQNAQVGIFYSVWENGRRLTTEVMGLGGNLTIEVNSDSIEAGSHKLDVMLRSACIQSRLKSSIVIEKVLAELSIPEVSACQEECVTLEANSVAGVLTYYWFASEMSADTLGYGPSWTTPPLLKSQTYYVSAALSSGCSTGRVAAAVNVKNFDPAVITPKGSDTLRSNYASYNKWLLNDVLISTNREVVADQTGTYVLIVDTLGCVSSDSIEYVYHSNGHADMTDIDIYPNPVGDYLNFPPLDRSLELEILESSGKVCREFQRVYPPSQEGIRIDIKCLAKGTYFAVVRTGQTKKILKFIKTE